MCAFAAEQGYAPDFFEARLHHEICLSDPRKCAPEKLKTVIPPSHQVDLAKQAMPRAPAFGFWQLTVRVDQASCPDFRQERNPFGRFVSRSALCFSHGVEL